MSVQELQKFTQVSKYARYLADKKRRETWTESTNRVREMMVTKLPEIADDLNWAYDLVEQERVLGSQRILQFGGVPVLRHNARAYNCTSSYCDRLPFFQECFYLLLCGCGTGFSVQRQHVAMLPNFTKARQVWKELPKKTFLIPDTIEGWADAAGVLIASYHENSQYPEYEDCEVIFDYSLIRPKGSYLSSGTGKAPGPEPLRKTLDKVRTLLNRCIYNKQEKLEPVDAYDIVMHCSDAVLSGGVRRAASLAMFSIDDDGMLTAKTGDWRYTNPQRARSNNSAVLLRNGTSEEEFLSLLSHVKQFGEPGFIWVEHLDALFNPCVEAGFYARLRLMMDSPLLSQYHGPVYKQGDGSVEISGWQMCNLTTQNGKLVTSPEIFYENCVAQALIGTAQATFTDFPYLGAVSEQIIRREALLGCSITGIMDSPDILLDPEILRIGAKVLVDTNTEYAAKLGINPAARIGNIKPEGTTSLRLGTASGAGAHHSERYFRNVQVNAMEIPGQYFAGINPLAVEECVWNKNQKDYILSFCVEAPPKARLKHQMTAIEMLDVVKLLYENWVVPSKRPELCTRPWVSHNISNTITVEDHEWDEVGRYIYKNRYCFAGIALLSSYGDKDYPQAPFTAVYRPEEIAQQYGDGSIFVSGLIESALDNYRDVWQASDSLLGQWYDANGKLVEANGRQEAWLKKAKRFADRYFGGDVRKLSYCMKDVHNWKRWLDLKREYKPVDYTLMLEEEDNTKPVEEVACSGGACSLV